jgi:6-phosphogluconolactonase
VTELRVVADPAAVAAERIAKVAETGGSLVLAGGSTPRRSYEMAASANWSRAVIWFGDERCVPPDDDRSNYGMVREALLDRLLVPPVEVHRIKGELGAQSAAQAYEDELNGSAPFDLVLLGLGSDAHTASLFPGKPALQERIKRAAAVPEAGLEPFVPRVTLTIPALAASREMLFLVAGADKAQAVARSFGQTPEETPAALVAQAAEGNVTVLMDAPAASRLPGALITRN